MSAAELKAVVLRLPQLIGDNYELALAPSLDRLQARLGLADEQMRFIVTKCPQLLGLEYEVEIAPKLDALSERLRCASDAELAESLLQKPSDLLKAGVEVRGIAAAVRKGA